MLIKVIYFRKYPETRKATARLCSERANEGYVKVSSREFRPSSIIFARGEVFIRPPAGTRMSHISVGEIEDASR